ncbi:MAG: D-alanyl-D-alanine carboxypeptidase [Candidatus Levybacteria bacterium]|nr:D-alanyl-D-alanine carboxypeptidase [Candidatus Levybacteria bacterium]
MRKFAISTLIIGCLTLILVAFILIFSQKTRQILRSPLPDFLTSFRNSQVSTLTIWKPNLENQVRNSIKKPVASAKSALVYDLTTDTVTFAKDPKEKVPMASLTKIMTAIVALENKRKDGKYIVRKEDLVGEDSMGLTEGEILTLEELLYGLILHSANDAAETIANNYIGGRERFIEAMNDKAKSLGLMSTNFTNPSGLEGDGAQYTSAYDLLVMTRYAVLNFPTFTKITSTYAYTLPSSKNHKEFYLENETNLITSYPGVKGIKTGYTPEAGFCLVTYLEYEGYQIIGILLNSDNRREEMKQLLDYSLKSLGVEPPKHS